MFDFFKISILANTSLPTDVHKDDYTCPHHNPKLEITYISINNRMDNTLKSIHSNKNDWNDWLAMTSGWNRTQANTGLLPYLPFSCRTKHPSFCEAYQVLCDQMQACLWPYPSLVYPCSLLSSPRSPSASDPLLLFPLPRRFLFQNTQDIFLFLLPEANLSVRSFLAALSETGHCTSPPPPALLASLSFFLLLQGT